ncbi:ABC transporter ATP-binding protein [Pseudonocardia sp. CA-142604]|uniref:ABC transporter ATP-binding protein n=1 Tax=Pseudonocardia sp. CA-142604 TaxID=3240024 RepID=UPI003D94BC42
MTAQAGDAVLDVRDLRVTFRTDDGRVSAVDGVSFDVRPGEVLAVVGESGCGKSVTAMSIAGLLPGSATVTGSVQLRGRELVGAPEPMLRTVRGAEVAYIFQEPMTSLNPVFTVGSQIAETLRIHQGLSRKQALARAVELLGLVGIPSPAARVGAYPHQFSGGMRQRVMIAMALACDPAVLVADEPTTALDVTVQAAVLDLLRDLGKRLGTAIVLITHDLGVVADIADRVLVMYAGRVVETAPTQELFDAPRHHYTLGLLGAVPTAGRRAAGGRLQEIPGLVPVLQEQPDSCTFAERCPAADERCRASAPALVVQESDSPADPDDERSLHRAACWHPAEALLVKGR